MVAISRADFLLLMVGLRDSDPGKDEQIAFLLMAKPDGRTVRGVARREQGEGDHFEMTDLPPVGTKPGSQSISNQM